ncbi:MAG: M42 family metallopeptidase [Candidatus Bathyarchaeota archaeon]|nr:M42 family metallopeptidase [Candidatus Bathyarchaeota archaeon]
MSFTENLEKLSNACGVAGREEETRKLLIEMLKPYVDEVSVDRLGNVISVKKGKEGKPKVMLAAHMDEVGLMIKNITKEGFLKFIKMGGIDDRILLAQQVNVHTENATLPGVVGAKPPHIQKEDERKKIVTYDNLFIDIGASSKEEAQKMGVKVGDPVAFDAKYVQVGKDIGMGKAFDDRVGCAAMVEAMKQLGDTNCTVYAVGTIQEEVGLRGAGAAAFGVDPDVAIALDVTVAGDVPGVREFDTSVKLGKGPAITVTDAGLITHPKVLRWFMDAAAENNIDYQLETGLMGSTDAARISLTRQGIPSGTISIPARYIHSPTGLINLNDSKNAAKLAAATIQKIQNIP